MKQPELSEAEIKKETRRLLAARNPAEYIERSIKSRLSSGVKASVTVRWCDENGFTVKDIQYARNRNPYWKKIKSKGSLKRNLQRFNEHDYRRKGRAHNWTDRDLVDFLDKQDELVDWELARRFKTTIPAVQGIRRKINLARRLLEHEGRRITRPSVLKLIRRSEPGLRKELDSRG